jgi:hypothetical protein
MAIERLTDDQIEKRLDALEVMMARADAKDLPSLNQTYQMLIDEQVRRDRKADADNYR